MREEYPLYDEKSGRFYRVAGKNKTIREYEPEIVTTKGTFSESLYKTLDKTPQIPKPLEPVLNVTCPFSKMGIRCTGKNCAFYGEGGCLTSGSESLGRRCPLNALPCHTDCSLYMDGCILCKERKSNEKQ